MERGPVDVGNGCIQTSRPAGPPEHDADRWVAATAIRLGISLVSNDRIFEGTPGLFKPSGTEAGGSPSRSRRSAATSRYLNQMRW